MINVGQEFPSFNLPNQDGLSISLESLKGKWVVFFVYPKDDTPG